MQLKSLGRIALACFMGAIITGIISAVVWASLIYIISGVDKDAAPGQIRAIDSFVVAVFVAMILGIITGTISGLIISAANLKPLKSSITGALVSYIFPMLFSVDDIFWGSSTLGYSIKHFGIHAITSIIPQTLTGGLGGLILGFIFNRARTVEGKPNV